MTIKSNVMKRCKRGSLREWANAGYVVTFCFLLSLLFIRIFFLPRAGRGFCIQKDLTGVIIEWFLYRIVRGHCGIGGSLCRDGRQHQGS